MVPDSIVIFIRNLKRKKIKMCGLVLRELQYGSERVRRNERISEKVLEQQQYQGSVNLSGFGYWSCVAW